VGIPAFFELDLLTEFILQKNLLYLYVVAESANMLADSINVEDACNFNVETMAIPQIRAPQKGRER
jgi:hypothetical protein